MPSIRSASIIFSASLLAACAPMHEPPAGKKEMTVEAALQSVTDSLGAYKRTQDARKPPSHMDVDKVTVELNLAYSDNLNRPVVVFPGSRAHHGHGDGGHGNRMIVTLKRHPEAIATPSAAEVRPPAPRPPLSPVPPTPSARKPSAHRKGTKQSAAEPPATSASDGAPAPQDFRLPPVTKPYDIIN
jgi:hypothetical protein